MTAPSPEITLSVPHGEPLRRLDETLVARGLVASRSRGRDAVMRGTVRLNGAVTTKPAALVRPGDTLAFDDSAARYVSRAALKLLAGLDAFAIAVEGRNALDLGASTGGFTQVLLERGASRVLAVDVGHGQMDATLAADPRVTLHEGVHARTLDAERLGGVCPELIVCDVSFISLKLALPAALELALPGCDAVVLVKPQFEVGRAAIGKGGLVAPAAAARAAEDIAAWLGAQPGWTVSGGVMSPIEGGSGNREYLLGARKAAG